MGGPRLAGFRVDLGEASACRRVGDADEVLAARTLDLAAGETCLALERLVTVRAVELELGGAHSFHLFMRKYFSESTPK